jgi:hypothetical protein
MAGYSEVVEAPTPVRLKTERDAIGSVVTELEVNGVRGQWLLTQERISRSSREALRGGSGSSRCQGRSRTGAVAQAESCAERSICSQSST